MDTRAHTYTYAGQAPVTGNNSQSFLHSSGDRKESKMGYYKTENILIYW